MILTHLHGSFFVESGTITAQRTAKNTDPTNNWNRSEIQVPLKKESGIQNAESSTWNLESTAWNPESKALFDSLISGDIKKRENQRWKICLETERLDSHSYCQSRNMLI